MFNKKRELIEKLKNEIINNTRYYEKLLDTNNKKYDTIIQEIKGLYLIEERKILEKYLQRVLFQNYDKKKNQIMFIQTEKNNMFNCMGINDIVEHLKNVALIVTEFDIENIRLIDLEHFKQLFNYKFKGICQIVEDK